MGYKKSIILIILVIFLFSIAGVCASDVNDMPIASEDANQMELSSNNEITEDNLQTSEENTTLAQANDNECVIAEKTISNMKYPMTFTQLEKDINESQNTFEILYDYTFNNESDDGQVVIKKSNFAINGNNHIVDGNGQSGILKITGNNVTINNLIFINGNSTKGGAIFSTRQITLNNVTFINNNASYGGAICSNGELTLNNATFINNNATFGGAIACFGKILNICNSFVTSNMTSTYGQIYSFGSTVNIDNSEFINISSVYASAIYLEISESSIINSRFVNLTAEKTAGAIAVRWSGTSYIKGCEFINTKSFKNAGAILVDYGDEMCNVTIIDCVFKNSSSMIGGAYVQLGGNLLFDNTHFIDNKASCDGGAVYISYADSKFDNCNFTSNIAGYQSDYHAYGGAIYSDISDLIICDSNFIDNSAYSGNAIYACDSYYEISHSTFLNNTVAIFTDFDCETCILENNIYNNDTVITNESYSYATYVYSPALDLKLINNTINVNTPPSRFDLREWGLVTPIKDQGRMGACWTFGIINAVESALLKAYGLEFDLSEGNMHHNMLRYFPYGNARMEEAGSYSASASYLIGWYGPALEEEDTYDEIGKLSPFLTEGYDIIHIQDIIIVPNDEVPAGSKIKSAILNYGALAVDYYAETDDANGYYNPETSAHYINESIGFNHGVSVIGWDDNFSKDNFLITPPGDGAWIVKNSWGTEWGDEGIVYISYYDKTFLTGYYINDEAFGIVIENTVPYNKNYQHDFIWSGFFAGLNGDEITLDIDESINESIVYANQFEAASDDLIAAVGTYFNSSDVNYTVEIYVNDKLMLTQDGLSPFRGYHTIKLNEYIPIKKGDIFKAVITSNLMPFCYCPWSRVHFVENTSFFYNGHEWKDLYLTEDFIACLKVYTVEDVDNIINYTFKDLNNHINWSGDVLEIIHDYTFNNESDSGPVVIEKSNFTINGNNHIVDGKGQSGIFNITGNNVTINNLIFINGNSTKGGAIFAAGQVTLNNVTFINNNAGRGGAIYSNKELTLNNITFINNSATAGGAIAFYNNILNCSNSRFIDNSAERGSSIYSDNITLNVCNSFITSNKSSKYGQIYASGSTVNIDNSEFINISSVYASALYLENSKSSIINSRFVNLTADKSAGAIAIRWSGNSYIKGCEFINTKSFKNAGAILVDYGMEFYNATIIDCVFYNASSMIGGAYIQLGGNLILNSSNFTNSKAHVGGAVYISFANSTIDNCIFDSNELTDNSSTSYGGAIYCDMSNMTLTDSRFINNSAHKANAVYACDSWYNITNCLFANNANAIFTDFDKNGCNLNNNEYNNDSIITNQSFYAPLSFEYPALNLTLINNTINVSSIPSRFDLRDWGWITPVKNQGRMGSCWTFAFAEALETALLKATGIRYDISENYMQNLQIRYSDFGNLLSDEGGFNYGALANAASWLSVGEEEDEYDEVGKLSVFIDSVNKIRLHDVYFIMPDATDYVGDVKKAILNYGAVSITYASSNGAPYYNVKTSAQYINESLPPNHGIAIIGWDDNYSADNFLITPPGNGAWIVKNSGGSEWGDEGYFYLSYYEKSIFNPDSDTGIIYPFTACIFSNVIDYHVNYQTDLAGLYDFDGNYTQYSNEFTAEYDDMIAGVGTYFNQSGINYSFDIYVNNKLAHSQSGASEFAGYRTIVLSKYIPVKVNDTFKVVFKSNALPYEAKSRNHYIHGMSFVSADGIVWKDITLENKTVCLKVYTTELTIYTQDLVKIYKNDSKFEANIGVANESVTFELNGVNYIRISDENGTARIAINLNPGNYTIKTSYNGSSVENTITVLPTLIAQNLVKYFRNASQFYISLIDCEGNPVAGKNITMNINGVFYNRVTNENGTARLNINLNPGKYILTAIDPLTDLQMSYNITVLPVLTAEDVNMTYKDGTQFKAKLVDGEGNPLANVNVSFNINGVFYQRTTDENGTARLNINLMPGEYIITSEYDNARISNKITIIAKED